MLLELSVSRIALIESMQLQLGKGLCVFTGETGAGKSILLDAIGLLLGNRGSTDLIRAGADDAIVEGSFALDESALPAVAKLLQSWDIDFRDGDVVVSRRLYRSGRTVCRVNGQLATVQMLKELGAHLVQQHGQHESQSLLRPDEQMRLLDAYGRHDEALRDVHQSYDEWTRAVADLKHAQVNEQERIRRIDMLQFQMAEIDEAKLVDGEEEELRQERSKLAHVEKISLAVDEALELLDGNRQIGAAVQVTQAIEAIRSVLTFHEDLQQAAELLDTAQVHLDEASRELAGLLSGIEANPERLTDIEDRLALIRTLERKYGPDIAAILEYYAGIVAEYDQHQNHDEQLRKLQKQVEAQESRLEKATRRLHKLRVETARRFSEHLGEALKLLHMPHAAFQIEVNERQTSDGQLDYGPIGADVAAFLFSANKGAEARPIQKIASGGELSRTMLSIKSVLANSDDVDTLIFDEIDAGVSGAAAQSVAEQLLKLGQTRQVLCVTHSPQIAAAGQGHYHIAKRDRQNDTITEVQVLDGSGRVQEIARLLGSDVADDTAHRHAQAMLESFGLITPLSG